MPLRLTDLSLDWALHHAISNGDTDIFPELFEFKAIKDDWTEIKLWLQNQDITQWTVRPYRRCLVPKHRFGFRVSTQLDPLDFLVFTATIHEVGDHLEATRIPATDLIIHSYRFSPNSDGSMFSGEYGYRSFQERSRAVCDAQEVSHVVIADIADFFPRLYTHRIDNALDTALGVGHMRRTLRGYPGDVRIARGACETDGAS